MKNVVLNFIQLKLMVLSFLFTGLCVFSSSNIQAQKATVDDLYTSPQGQFVNAPTAITRLEIQLSSLKNTISNLVPGSQQYLELEAKYAYYDQIRSILVDGKTFDSAAVASAIGAGMGIFATDVYDNFSKTLKQEFKQSAINLLKQ
jgi:hypothetical protein